MNLFPLNPDAISELNSLPDDNASERPATEQSFEEKNALFAHVPEMPTQQGPAGSGILFDFNFGCRIFLPAGDWQVIVMDEKNNHLFGDTHLSEGMIESRNKYFIPFSFRVLNAGQQVMDYQMDLSNQPVLIDLNDGALGDTLAWFPAIVRFQQQHQCRLTCQIGTRFHELLAESYPHIRFTDGTQPDEELYYASYTMNLGIGKNAELFSPVEGHRTPLHHMSCAILGLPADDKPASVILKDDTPPLSEPYICIAVQSTAMCKYWNNPMGWLTLVNVLKARGYRVVCIDLFPITGHDISWHAIPNGAENQTGDRPLSERLRWLKHAEFFVGLGSGLSWLAWTAGIPVVLISGFSDPSSEFPTPWRVINRYVCNSCWNDNRYEFDSEDYFWCPRNKGTPNQFICSRAITAGQVLNTIATIPNLSF